MHLPSSRDWDGLASFLDINMPKLGGIEVAFTLRELEPTMHVALQTAGPHVHSNLAHDHRVPLFDKLEPQRALAWLDTQVKAWADGQLHARPPAKRALECSSCGYGIACWAPPARCPCVKPNAGGSRRADARSAARSSRSSKRAAQNTTTRVPSAMNV